MHSLFYAAVCTPHHLRVGEGKVKTELFSLTTLCIATSVHMILT